MLQLIIGDYSLSYDQERVQMALWSIMSAPLLMSNDLRTVSSQAVQLLQNENLIRVNQDPNGIQGRRIKKVKLNGSIFSRHFIRGNKSTDFSFASLFISV